MDLSHNQLGGPLPTMYFQNLMGLKNVQDEELKYMGEDYCQDTVKVVMKDLYVELVKIQTRFTTIDFSNNAFKGEIPRVIGELKLLKGLNFSSNKLTVDWRIRVMGREIRRKIGRRTKKSVRTRN
ncbi:hypothetical protein M0R45_015480 [Rubus argutus]|uniref:Uncharacterized protein n=1 Tax=Rubus argutus TaxID=59490 RepID=A0AAW1XS42_RUBAR